MYCCDFTTEASLLFFPIFILRRLLFSLIVPLEASLHNFHALYFVNVETDSNNTFLIISQAYFFVVIFEIALITIMKNFRDMRISAAEKSYEKD
jgi:hypothetical protein